MSNTLPIDDETIVCERVSVYIRICTYRVTTLTDSTVKRQEQDEGHLVCFQQYLLGCKGGVRKRRPALCRGETGTFPMMTPGLAGDHAHVCVSGPCGWPRAQEDQNSKVQSTIEGPRRIKVKLQKATPNFERV